MEANSLQTVAMHLRHFERTVGERFTIRSLALSDLQRHVTERARKRYRGRPLSPVTLRKEVASLRAAWNWGTVAGVTSGPFPSRGLVYPKGDQKPPFRTMQEIERDLATGSFSDAEIAERWECLYLRKKEIEQLLDFVSKNAAHDWIYPLVCTAAYTGARRSELLRAQVSDVDLIANTMLIREKKRSRSQRTSRHVALTPALQNALKDWLTKHRGGRQLFCFAGQVARSKKRIRAIHQLVGKFPASATTRAGTQLAPAIAESLSVTRDEAHDHFKRTLAGSKWAVLRGFHVLRHSFISCLASGGVDQRIIDDFVGHPA